MGHLGQDHTTFIIRQLERTGRQAYRKGNEIVTLCVSPQHKDKNPSCYIRCNGACFICWSCGFSGSWLTIVSLLSLDYLPGQDPNKESDDLDLWEVKRSLEALEEEDTADTTLPVGSDPWSPLDDYRGYSHKLLTALGTRLWYDFPRSNKDVAVGRILWPFTMGGQLVGGTGRLLPSYEPKQQDYEGEEQFSARKKAFERNNPKYRNLPGIKVSRILFPYDYVQTPSIALVEGPTSALRFLDAGIPSLAILGVKNWNDYKGTLLIKKGIKRILICMDGDKAGRECTTRIVRDTEDLFDVRYVDFPDGIDPGNCSDKMLAKIKKQVVLSLILPD